MIRLVVNGEKITIKKELNILEYLEQISLDPQTVIIELNLKIIKRELWANTNLKKDDQLEIIHFVGGG